MFYKINYVIQICPRFVPHLFHIFAKFFLDLSKICPRFVPNFPQIFPTFSQIFPRFAPDFLQIFPDLSQICPRIFFSCPIYIQVQLWIQANHGAPGNSKGKRHVGDLGNIQAENGKEASIDITDSIISLWGERSIIGRAIVVHEGADDLGLGGDEGSKTTGRVILHKSCSGVSLKVS